jgi:hypothetical protein
MFKKFRQIFMSVEGAFLPLPPGNDALFILAAHGGGLF